MPAPGPAYVVVQAVCARRGLEEGEEPAEEAADEERVTFLGAFSVALTAVVGWHLGARIWRAVSQAFRHKS